MILSMQVGDERISVGESSTVEGSAAILIENVVTNQEQRLEVPLPMLEGVVRLGELFLEIATESREED